MNDAASGNWTALLHTLPGSLKWEREVRHLIHKWLRQPVLAGAPSLSDVLAKRGLDKIALPAGALEPKSPAVRTRHTWGEIIPRPGWREPTEATM